MEAPQEPEAQEQNHAIDGGSAAIRNFVAPVTAPHQPPAWKLCGMQRVFNTIAVTTSHIVIDLQAYETASLYGK